MRVEKEYESNRFILMTFQIDAVPKASIENDERKGESEVTLNLERGLVGHVVGRGSFPKKYMC